MPKAQGKSKPDDLWIDEEDVLSGRKQASPKLKTISRDYRIKPETPKRQPYRNVSPTISSDEGASLITVKAAPLIKRRNYNTNWRSSERKLESPTSWRARSISPLPYFRSCKYRSSTPRRDYARCRSSTDRSSPQRFHKTFMFKLLTNEPAVLRSARTGKLYAKFPEGTTISADAQGKGQRGERTYQTNKAVQVPEKPEELTSFQNSFGKMRL